MKDNRGQVALVVLLMSAAVMTLGMSLSKRTVLETKIDADEELLKKAFNAAESGIDYYLGTGRTTYTSPNGEIEAEVTVNDVGGGPTLDFGEYTLAKNGILFWLVGHNADGSINLSDSYGGNTLNVCVNNDFTGSLKVDFFYRDGSGNYQVKRTGYNLGVTGINGYTDQSGVGANSCGDGKKLINASSILEGGTTPLLVSITPMFGGTNIILSGSANFPIQGSELVSLGRAGDESDLGGVNRQVRLVNRYKVPSFLMESITAGNSVLSN